MIKIRCKMYATIEGEKIPLATANIDFPTATNEDIEDPMFLMEVIQKERELIDRIISVEKKVKIGDKIISF